jgi:hypothetical protein
VISPFSFLLLALAAYRVTHLIALDDLIDRPREWFVRRVGGPETMLGSLVTCPTCTGVWVSAAVLLAWFHGGRVAFYIVAGAAVAGAVSLLSSWEGEG